MDSAGRLVIPRNVRREASLEPGVPLVVRVSDGIVEIEPAPLPVRLERRGRLTVAVPARKAGTLDAATVERTRRDVTTGRGR